MSRNQVYTRLTRFKNGRKDLNDDPRPGRPKASNRAELVKKVREIIAIDADFTVPEGKTVNGEYYLQVLHRLWSRKVRVRPEYPEGKQLFVLNDNAPPHKTKKVYEFLIRKQICVIDHPPYSTDLSPCDYFLFLKLKNAINGAFYDDVPTIQAAVTHVPKNIPKTEIKKSMDKFVDRSKRCIELNGSYFE